MKYDVVGIGYPSLDYIIKLNSAPATGQTSIILNSKSKDPYYGGCAVNICYLLCSLDKKSAVAMTVGKDFEESGLKPFLEKNKVSLEFVQEHSLLNTSYTNLVMLPNGEHMTLFYPGPMAKEHYIPYNFSSLQATFGLLTIGEITGNKQFLEACIQKDIPLIFSMKGDYASLDQEYLSRVFAHSELIFMNETEFEQLNEYMPMQVKDYLQQEHLQAIVVTNGSRGSTIFTKEQEIDIPSYPDTQVVDTAGGGDAYIAGFLASYLEKQKLVDCAIAGTSLASFIIEDFGCLTNIPTVEELEIRKQTIREEM